jgi:methyl-accepting chemotaxis protein
LQELASSLQQVDELAATSVTSAAEAADLARRVADGATASLEASNQAVLSMAAVTQDAGRIADMTNVINGIAFQTNLLALNAAVEAARAGEQGKGFAVVAGEVRGLSQRAADAARDIQSLLDSSRASVDSGNAAVRSAAKAAQRIGAAAGSLSSLTDDLVARTQTQTQCIAIVSGNAKSLESGGQRNSALAEETNAASESLQEQAARLRGLVEAFRV